VIVRLWPHSDMCIWAPSLIRPWGSLETDLGHKGPIKVRSRCIGCREGLYPHATYLPTYLPIYPSIHPSVRPSVRLSVCLSVCLQTLGTIIQTSRVMANWHPGFVHSSVCVLCVCVCARARVVRHCSVGISSMTYSLAYQWWHHFGGWGGVGYYYYR
jgi:hypothetical protein